MLYLHPESLSPDPTYGRQPRRLPGNRVGMTVYPSVRADCLPPFRSGDPPLMPYPGGTTENT